MRSDVHEILKTLMRKIHENSPDVTQFSYSYSQYQNSSFHINFVEHDHRNQILWEFENPNVSCKNYQLRFIKYMKNNIFENIISE